MSLLKPQKKGNSKDTLPRHHGTHMGLPNTIRADLKDKLKQRLKTMDCPPNRSRLCYTQPLELPMCSDGSLDDEGPSPTKRRRKGLFLFRAIRTRKSRFGLAATRIDTGICTSPHTALVLPASNADTSIDGMIDDEFLDAL